MVKIMKQLTAHPMSIFREYACYNFVRTPMENKFIVFYYLLFYIRYNISCTIVNIIIWYSLLFAFFEQHFIV